MLLTSQIRDAIENQLQVRDFGAGRSKANFTIILKNAQSNSIRLLYVASAMAAVLFVVMIVFIIHYRDDATILMGLSAVFGSSIAGLIALVVRMSKSVTQAGILLAMASHLPDEDVLEAIKALLGADSGAKDADIAAAKANH